VFLRNHTREKDGEFSDATAAIAFLNPKIFSRVGSDCQIFKVKLGDSEFIFAKRHGKWFLDNPKSDLEMGDELISNFFHELLLLEGITLSKPRGGNVSPDFSITLYGKNSSERVIFFAGEEDLCLVTNDMPDLSFTVSRESFAKMLEATQKLLKFRVFSLPQCGDINIALASSGEHFNFHDLKSQNKWQITYSKDGEVRVEEISVEKIDEILRMLRNVESVNVLSELYVENKSFTVAFDEGSNLAQIFNFYEDDGKVFVEPNGQGVKFEIDGSFVPAFFARLRAIFEKIGSVTL
jgi:hypothetical protein